MVKFKTVTPDDLSGMNKDELMELAQEINISGRSSMTKAELVESLRDNWPEEGAEADEVPEVEAEPVEDDEDAEGLAEGVEPVPVHEADVEIVEPKDVEGALAPDEVLNDPVAEAKRSTERVRELRERDNELFVELARELWLIREHDLFRYVENPHRGVPYESMAEYLDIEVTYSERKARYLFAIYSKFEIELGSLVDVMHVGWTKLKEIQDVVNEDNLDEWVDLASSHSTSELKELVKQKKIEDGVIEAPTPEGLETDPTERMVFNLFADQLGTVNQALETAREIADVETNNKGELLSLICSDFLATNGNVVGGGGVPIDAYLSNLESATGVRLVAFKGSKLIFGEDTIDDIAGDVEEADAAPELEADGEPEDLDDLF